jgi:lipopolysaccharide transport system ATP-binding protein
MSSPVISVSNLSKSYRLGMIGGGTLREDFSRWWAKVRGRPDPTLKIGQGDTRMHGQEFQALRNVSFDVQQGEILGIIGRNGAGKSTLLKILSRVTAPTSGEVRVKGRIASLLEVGTGFHPELTGRENIFLNGAILGMSKAEIRRKFDEIVAFSGVEEFIDTPVKRYSSGMYVRLAFAVAAHLEPEILIVDEVLAVGDGEFQKKCLGKMKDVARCGRTVLFVTHNMQAIKQLCETAILLSNGTISFAGAQLDAITEYQNALQQNGAPAITGSREVILSNLTIKNHADEVIRTFNTFDKVTFELTYKSCASLRSASFALCFDDINGNRVTSLWSSFQNKYFDVEKDEFKCVYTIESVHLSPGVYSIVLYAETNGRVLERIDNYAHITVGYLEKHGPVKLPERMHGGYTEAFNVSIK